MYGTVSSKSKRDMFAEIKQFRAKVEAGDPPIGPMVTSPDPRVTDAIGDSVDFIWVDMEHFPMSYEALTAHIMAAHLHGVAVIVRVQGPNCAYGGGAPWGWSIKAALDCGVDGIIVPQVRTADDVRAMVSDCRYPTGPRRAAPFNVQMVGPSTDPSYRKRGMGHMIPSNYFREDFYEYTYAADASIYTIVQIETKEAVENIDEICDVPGLDSIVFGQMDLSGSFGYPHCPSWEEVLGAPALHAGMLKVCAACKRTAVHCGVSTGDQETIAQLLELVDKKGWIHIGADMALVASGMDALVDATRTYTSKL